MGFSVPKYDQNTILVIGTFTIDAMNKELHSEIKDKILQAAQERLWHFGYKKTTIDEIAADAGIGKGTIYLHFNSKEEIALAIVTQFKTCSIVQERAVAGDQSQPILQRLKEVLLIPILASHERCSQSPAALEMATTIRPNIQAHLKPLMQEEIKIIAQLLEEGNAQGVFHVEDVRRTAQTLHNMSAGFWPPFSCVSGSDAIRSAVSEIVDLVYRGLSGQTSIA